MRKIILSLFISLIMITGLTACGNKSPNNSSNPTSNSISEDRSGNESGTIKKINSDEAKALIGDGAILVDVRTKKEYDDGHIDGSILVPLDDIENLIVEEIQDKDTNIIVYCRSGRRSNIAAEKLINMGYKNVYDLGSISSWKE